MTTMLTTLTDTEAMTLAIKIAKEGAGRVSPNPLVGCVILSKDNVLLSSGYHQFFGGPHAEINALKNLDETILKDSRVFVTLEPCSHYGKTPPCAKTLAELPIGEIIYGVIDPNPMVAGKGIEHLQCAGKKVTAFNGLKFEFEELIEVFLQNQRNGEIFVSLKVATSLDGMMGLKTGESKWITNETSRQYSHYLRATHDAILVGANTILTDNPSLNIRHAKFENKSNLVIILDPNGKCLPTIASLSVASTHKPSEIFVFVKEKLGAQSSNCQILEAPIFEDGFFDLNFILKILWNNNIRSILVEGGSCTLSEFLNQNKAHRLYQFIAPQLIGGTNGLTWTSQFNVASLQDRITLSQLKTFELDQNLLFTGLINNPQIAKIKNIQKTLTHSNKDKLKFFRSPDGWFFGVCQGLGESFNIPPTLVRFFWILSFFFYGLGFGVYLALAISLPRKDKIEKFSERQVLGVCVTLSKKFGLEVGIVRFLAILLTLTTGGFAILAYIVLYFAFDEK